MGKIIKVIVNLVQEQNKYSKAQRMPPNDSVFYKLQQRANEETIEYINENMQSGTIGIFFNDKLMKYALSNLIIPTSKGLVLEFGVDTGKSINFI